MYINAHAFLLPLYLHICVFLWKNVIHHVPCSSSSPSSSVLMQPLIIPNLSPSLPLSEPLCPRYSPPSYNDLVITGAAFPALVSRGVWGLIGTEWVRVCVAVRPDWHRTGIQGYPLQELYYRVYIQGLTLKHSTSTNKKCFKHTNTCMFKCVVYSKTLYFYFWVVLFIKCAKTCCFFCPPLLEQFVKLGLTANFWTHGFRRKDKKGIWWQLILEESMHLIHLLRTFISDQSCVEMSICNTWEEIAQFLYLLFFFFYLNIPVDCMFWAFKLCVRIEAHLSKEWVGLCLEQWWNPVWF